MELRNDDVFSTALDAHQIWLATQSLNQYLPVERLCALLDVFVTNGAVPGGVLRFDCVDPLRFSLLPHGIAFRTEARRRGGRLRRWRAVPCQRGSALEVAARLAAGRTPSSAALRARGMGYGYLPRSGAPKRPDHSSSN
ncbi:MAG: hypothetical protein R2755_28070 [Acidimicrobiales bacterium]